MSLIVTPISHGELIDKITILEIKSEQIADPAKLANVRKELELLDRVWREDAAAAGFDDEAIYEEISLTPGDRRIPMDPLLREEGLEVFREWIANPDKIEY